jgi:hypothetical protein
MEHTRSAIIFSQKGLQMEAPHQETDPLLSLVSKTEESEAAAVLAGSSSVEDSVTFFEPEAQKKPEQQKHSSSKAAFDLDLFWEIFEELKVFREENGRCCVSQKSSKKEEELSNNLFSLGVWVKEQQ